MVIIVKWFIRLLLLIIVVDWFNMKWNEKPYLSPAGMVMIDLESRTVARCAFGCSANDLNEGDVVPMEIRFTTYEEITNESQNEKKED